MIFSYTQPDGKPKFSYGLFALFASTIGIFMILSIWFYKKKRISELEDIFHPSIGGWMVLPIIVGCAIWFPYFHYSLRVKEPFIK
jgi:hypothetical protein